MEYIRIFDRNSKSFNGNGLAVLDKAENLHITKEINGDYSLDFKYPVNDAKMKYITPESICKYDGQLFRVRVIAQGEISAKAVYLDAARKHLQYVDDMIGETPYNIICRLFRDTPVHVMSYSETSEKGLIWITEKTDFFEISKKTPIGALELLTEQLEKQHINCELYIDNYNIALVKSIGSDVSHRISLKFNASKTNSEINSTELITRLYPYGADDLDISTVNKKQLQYIDSPNIDKFGVIEGYMEFNDCEEPDELLRLAKWQFSEYNINRIDVPKYSMEVKYVNVSEAYRERGLKTISLGDKVSIVDQQTGHETIQRIIKTDIYPNQPNKSTIDVGQSRITFESFLRGINSASSSYISSVNSRNEVKTSSLEMMRGNKRVNINNALRNQRIGLYDTGALFESPDGSCAVAIINGALAIAAGKQDGEWDWTTVIDHNEVTVSEVFTGALYTNLCSILSENGKLEIENSLITMKDKNDTVRFECGCNDDKYIFCLYNPQGRKTVYIDDTGEVYFAGTLYTNKDAKIGTSLSVGLGANAVIKFEGPATTEGQISVIDKVMTIEANEAINIIADSITVNGKEITNRSE